MHLLPSSTFPQVEAVVGVVAVGLLLNGCLVVGVLVDGLWVVVVLEVVGVVLGERKNTLTKSSGEAGIIGTQA